MGSVLIVERMWLDFIERLSYKYKINLKYYYWFNYTAGSKTLKKTASFTKTLKNKNISEIPIEIRNEIDGHYEDLRKWVSRQEYWD